MTQSYCLKLEVTRSRLIAEGDSQVDLPAHEHITKWGLLKTLTLLETHSMTKPSVSSKKAPGQSTLLDCGRSALLTWLEGFGFKNIPRLGNSHLNVLFLLMETLSSYLLVRTGEISRQSTA